MAIGSLGLVRLKRGGVFFWLLSVMSLLLSVYVTCRQQQKADLIPVVVNVPCSLNGISHLVWFSCWPSDRFTSSRHMSLSMNGRSILIHLSNLASET